MLLELHAHSSRYSGCSLVDPETLVREAQAKGLAGLVLTEHQYQWDEAELAEVGRAAGLRNGFALLSGQELETDIGHVLAYGLPRTERVTVEIARIRREHPAAALVWAHPFRYATRPPREALLQPALDAVEIVNGNQSDEENATAWRSWQEHGFRAVAGSDTHCAGRVGVFPTRFPAPIRSIADLAAAIRAGQARPGEPPWFPG